MNTNWKSNSIQLMACLLFVLLFSSCKKEHSKQDHANQIQVEGDYICPMHCEGDKTYSQPGNCPVCKMQLQLVEKELIQVVSPNKQVLSRQATLKLQSETETQTLKANGYIDIDDTQNKIVSAWFGGRIEKLFVTYNFQFVSKGDKILELYSPELNTVQEQHLFLLKTETNQTLIEQSRVKMKLLGITPQQISELERKGKFAQTISVFSTASGYLFFNSGNQSSTRSDASQPTAMDNGMSASPSATQTSNSSGLQIREGVYINKGEPLFTINSLQTVWAIISLPSEYQTYVQPGKPVNIVSELFPGKILNGKTLLTEQTFEETQQRFVRVRIELLNPKAALKINSLVTSEIPLTTQTGYQIPVSAVYRTGMNAYVWVKTGTTKNGTGFFQLRKVVTGPVSNGIISLLSGLSPDEEIALHAGLLADSETFLNSN